MSTLQIILLVLTILATLYEIIQVSNIQALVSHYGAVRTTPGFWLGLLTAVAIQTAFVVSLLA